MSLNRKKLKLDSLHFWLVFVSGSIVVIVLASAPQMPWFFELVSTSSSSFLCPISSFIIQCAEEKKRRKKYHVCITFGGGGGGLGFLIGFGAVGSVFSHRPNPMYRYFDFTWVFLYVSSFFGNFSPDQKRNLDQIGLEWSARQGWETWESGLVMISWFLLLLNPFLLSKHWWDCLHRRKGYRKYS